ncbi:MAG: plastocyanin/azurin family copper-binding protein [Nitrosopumilus sp.]|nr:plastocyanin/azurin family copper-binding protein [Nitrosopumilus sp.]
MNVILLLLAITILFSIPLLIEVYAQTSYDVNIPTGAASPDAPYFWQNEKDGSTSGIIKIMIGDTIVWKNADTAAHTVTSGTASDGPDNLFDSGLFAPGKSFSYTFTETGYSPYFCLVHPWMDGSVTVTTGYYIIPNVGKQAGDGSTFFDVEYDFNGVLSTVAIDEQQKSITFEIVSNIVSGNNDLELRLPSELLDGPFVVWVDDQKLSDFEHIQDDGLNVLLVPLDADSKIITIVGTSIVPEFGPMTMVILTVSIVTMVFLSQRFKTLT